ncbi:MAG TPA: TetR/AcrR family transcriptional regulator [Thermomonas sp.]|jgi:AcrR family transcriptional regulator|uniref:TetR/AcrR family transcriptional regulator n=1 Tax=Thermomonas sp. TaxID=1971895 RepID=UPI002B62FEA8|nr:TetR/AcrR family transcriptional regulator [Thermomonas sp.]HOC11894.1 TetR/AcrR family transcriptional regulator [Thermomonas sp.]HQA02512.1 TetR/AcrR family transcriptional regulator [Thermomonas sp.]
MSTPAPRKKATSAPRKRAPGRPAADAPDQRASVLDAALACFVRQGIGATSLRDIAREAGVTPALLHYYFGDKPQLQAAVVEERLMPVMAMLREPLQQAGDDVAALIAGFVGGVGKMAIAHPWLPPLWVREVLCEGGALRDVMFQRVGPVIPNMMAARFAAAQARGEIQPDLDPRLLMVSLVGLTLFPIAGAPIWRQLFEADDLDIETLRKHTLALLDRGVGIN